MSSASSLGIGSSLFKSWICSTIVIGLSFDVLLMFLSKFLFFVLRRVRTDLYPLAPRLFLKILRYFTSDVVELLTAFAAASSCF